MPALRLPARIRSPAPSRLFNLDQRAAKIFRVQEQYRLAVGADLRLAVADALRQAIRAALGAAWNKKPTCHVHVLEV